MSEDKTFSIGIVGKDNEPLEYVQSLLNAEGITLRLVEFSDYFAPNEALAKGTIDANLYQHLSFLNAQRRLHHYDFEIYGTAYLDPIGIYSKKIRKIEDLGAHALVGVPADSANEKRALKVLSEAGLIEIKEDSLTGTTTVISNPLHLNFKKFDASVLYQSLNHTDISFINGNYAFDNGLNPVTDSIYREKLSVNDTHNEYVKIFVAKNTLPPHKQNLLRRVVARYQCPEVARIISTIQGGSLIPAFRC